MKGDPAECAALLKCLIHVNGETLLYICEYITYGRDGRSADALGDETNATGDRYHSISNYEPKSLFTTAVRVLRYSFGSFGLDRHRSVLCKRLANDGALNQS